MGEFISSHCNGQRCFCGLPAYRLLEEVLLPDEPDKNKIPQVSYVCRTHYNQIMRIGKLPVIIKNNTFII